MALALRAMSRFLPSSSSSSSSSPVFLSSSNRRCSSKTTAPVFFSVRCCSSQSFPPPNVAQLAEKARITLSPEEIEDFHPKLEQIVGWFGQLQEVDLENILPSLRVDAESQRPLREDVTSCFENRDAMLAAIPEAEGPYIKVPKILNENIE